MAATGLRPHVSAVLATPTVPAVSQPVTVTATVTGQTSVVVRYQVDFTGEQTVAMTSLGGDAYTATLPGAAAGHLIRYRVEATNAAGTSYSPRLDDSSPFKGVVVASGVTSAVPVIEWFMNDADYNLITQNPLIDITRAGVLAYNGSVYDSTMFSIRGEGTQDNPKVSWKVVLPQDHTLQIAGLVEPVDEFAMNADWSDSSHGRTTLAWDSYQTAGVVNEQIMQLRVQKNSTFFGLYTYTDIFEGTWRSREGYSNKQFYKGGHAGFDATKQLVEYRFEKKNPEDEDFTTLAAFLNGVDLTGTAQKNNLLATANIPEMINYAVATAIVEHTDSSTKNFYLSQDPTTGRWSVIPWDLDHTFGHKCCGVNSNFVTPAEPGDQASELMTAILAVPEWKQMYFRRLRTVLNSVLATGRLEAVYDAKVGPAAPESTLDFAKWPHTGGSLNFASQRTLLFKAIQARRNVFAADSRVPANQSAAPNIVIDEIQPSLVNGAGGQFVELYNPSATEAVDLSGWALSGSVNLQIQPGTVILPGGRMTFVANDPAFEDTYGGLVFVGGVFGGGLGASGTHRAHQGGRVDSGLGRLRRRRLAGRDRHPLAGAGRPDVRQLPRDELGAVDGVGRLTGCGQPDGGRRQPARRADHRRSHRRRRGGDGELDGAVEQRRLTDHRLPGAGAGREQRPGRRGPAGFADRDQSLRHRPDRRDAVHLPGRGDQRSRRRCAVGGVGSRHAGADPRVVASDHHRGDPGCGRRHDHRDRALVPADVQRQRTRRGVRDLRPADVVLGVQRDCARAERVAGGRGVRAAEGLHADGGLLPVRRGGAEPGRILAAVRSVGQCSGSVTR